ncbi:MAG: HPr family phosphocarrier protein [Candidatus Omnitrophica bacterium]|nr:HPr family phosphocarrier protein [Candidatus Omnitrophota bacterium]
MPTLRRTVTVVHRQGLHARPAALFVDVAKRFSSRITVKKGRKSVDGKSIMGLLTLAANQGARIALVADGPDAHEAIERLSRVVTESLADAARPAASRHVP